MENQQGITLDNGVFQPIEHFDATLLFKDGTRAEIGWDTLQEIITNYFATSSFTPVYVPKDEEEAKVIQECIDRINLRDGVVSDSEKQSTERVYPPIEPKEGEHPTAVYSFHRSNTQRQGAHSHLDRVEVDDNEIRIAKAYIKCNEWENKCVSVGDVVGMLRLLRGKSGAIHNEIINAFSDKYKGVRASNGKIPFLIIERLDICIPTGEVFEVFEENVKLTFPGTGQIHASIPIWVIEEAISRYCNDPAICTRYAS